MKKDPHHINKILEALANGEGRVRACVKADITYETFTCWMRDDSEFSESIKKAEDTGNDKIKDLCKRKIIEDKSWQSGAWWLERVYPEEFKLKTELKHEGHITNEPTKEQIDKLLDKL